MTYKELESILLSEKPSIFIREREEEIFEIIPELRKCKGFDQKSDWHEFDVLSHILKVVDNVPAKIEFRLGALFHDIGKPATFVLDDKGKGHFPDHWIVSREKFLEFSNKYKLDPIITKNVANLIYYHDLDFNKEDNLILDAVEKIGYDNISNLFIFKKADVLAQKSDNTVLASELEAQKKDLIK